jgi:hypothetical protein
MSRASNLAGFSTSISPPTDLVVGVVTAVSLSIGQDVNVVGIVTATSFSGDGAGLTGLNIPATSDWRDSSLF